MARCPSLGRKAFRRLAAAGFALGLLAGPTHGQDCKADPDWFKPDAPEPDFAKHFTTNCQFHQWAVQELLYLVQPEKPDELARFLHLASPHALFLFKGSKPAPYPGAADTRFELGAGMAGLKSKDKSSALSRTVFLPRTPKTANTTFRPDITQAGSNAVLVDQKGNPVYYTSHINKAYYDFVVEKEYYTLAGFLAAPKATTFPVGTLETKTAWRIAVKGKDQNKKVFIPDAAKTFYTIDDAQLCEDEGCRSPVPATMALVGFHVVGAVLNHPEMIWATFEHKDNAPDCKDSGNYSFQVCRAHPNGEPGATDDNTPNIQALNRSFHQGLPAESVWRNYDYAGAVWTTGQAGPGGLIALDAELLKGSKKLANTSLESYTQEKNCLHCHTYQPIQSGDCFPDPYKEGSWKNLYVTHLFGLLCPKPGIESTSFPRTKGSEKPGEQ